MSGMSWQFDLSWPYLAIGAAVLGFTLALSVRQIRREGPSRAYFFVEALRWLAALLVVFTLLRPEVVRELDEDERPQVAVLWDASDSMQTLDVLEPGAAEAVRRADWLAARLASDAWDPLRATYDIAPLPFAEPPAEDAPPEEQESAGTDLGLALDGALERVDRLRAVVLLSDGDWNKGASPVTAATRLRLRDVPVFAVTVGHPRFLPDLELQSVIAPSYGLVEEHISVPFTVQSHLPREVRTAVTLEGPGGLLGRRDVTIPPMAQVQETIVFMPEREGEGTYTVRLPVVAEEADRANNEQSFPMEVRREQLKVLVVESLPRWEYRYLRNALYRDPGVDVRTLLLHPALGPGGGKDYLKRFPGGLDELSSFDVVVLGDIGVGPGELTPEQAEAVRGLVEQQGSGLVFLPGRGGRQLTLRGTALEDLLPVEFDATRPEGFGTEREDRLELTERGSGHLLTSLVPEPERNASLWQSLPGFSWCAGVLKARPGTDVLAVHPTTRNTFGRLPLLVTRQAGYGRVLFMGTDAAWRWRFGVEDRYHYRFWSQVARWMAHRRHLAHAEGIRFHFTPEQPERDRRVFLHATVFDAAGLPLDGGRVRVTVREPGGAEQVLPLDGEPGGWGVYTGGFVPRRGGTYNLAVREERTGREAESTLTVAAASPERIGRPARPEVLKEIAAVTRGEAAGAEGFDALLERIRLLPNAVTRVERFALWCSPWWGALLVLLLALSWAGRKLLGKL